MIGGRSPATMRGMSSTARFTWLVVGAVAVTLIAAAAISAAVDGGNSLPTLAHQVAIRTALGGDSHPADDRAQNPLPTALPAPQPTIDVQPDEPEPEPGEDQDRDGGRASVTTPVAQAIGSGRGPGDGHDSSDGRDSGGDNNGGRG
jgi:hypothetical protein